MAAQQYPRDYLDLLSRDPWFDHLTDDLAEQIIGAATIRHYTDKQPVFLRGGPPCGLYALLEGAVRITGVTESGREALLSYLEPISWFGEISLFDSLPRSHDTVAHGNTVLMHVPQSRMLDILDASPQYWRVVGLLMGFKLRLAFIGIEDLALLPAALRLMRRLVLMADASIGQTDAEGVRQIGIQQEQLALMLSLSRQTVNQVLKELETQGLVRLAYGRIDILDMTKLRAMAKLSDAQAGLLLHISRSASGAERRKALRA